MGASVPDDDDGGVRPEAIGLDSAVRFVGLCRNDDRRCNRVGGITLVRVVVVVVAVRVGSIDGDSRGDDSGGIVTVVVVSSWLDCDTVRFGWWL